MTRLEREVLRGAMDILRGIASRFDARVGGQETADWLRRVGMQLAEVIEQVQIVSLKGGANDDN